MNGSGNNLPNMGVPLATDKMEGLTHCLTFLGIEVDTKAGVLYLHLEKLGCMKLALRQWQHRKSCTKKELESLIRTLQDTCRVVRPGRSFLRQMIELTSIPKRRPHHCICLNNHFQVDLGWVYLG